jgi:type VII secretion protein EccB
MAWQKCGMKDVPARGAAGGHVQTRRDQLQAYRFVTTRVQSALLHGEPDAAETPMRRIGVSTFSGIMVAVLAVAGFGIFGLLRPGSKDGWKQPGVLVVEKETGTRFVYDPTDDALHPVLNYTSARLILNAESVSVQYFSRRSLSAAHRGLPYGLPNLPDSLPDARSLVTSPWTICSKPPSADSTLPTVTVSVGMAAAGQHIDPGEALLVQTTRYGKYLVWNDTRLGIPLPDLVLPVLGYAPSAAVTVADSWVNSVPPGPDLKAVAVPGRGQPGPSVGGQVFYAGQVLKVPAEGTVRDRYWLVLREGLTPVTETDALLLLGDPLEQRAYHGRSPTPVEVSAAAVGQAPPAPAVATRGFPDLVPTLLNPAQRGPQVVCSAYTSNPTGNPSVTVSLTDTAPGAREPTTVGFGFGEQASQVVLRGGSAAVARMVPHDGQPSSSLYLVTDAGGKYPVPSADVLRVLGYGSVRPAMVPKGILDLIPTGPALDPRKARSVSPIEPNSVSLPVSPAGSGGS